MAFAMFHQAFRSQNRGHVYNVTEEHTTPGDLYSPGVGLPGTGPGVGLLGLDGSPQQPSVPLHDENIQGSRAKTRVTASTSSPYSQDGSRAARATSSVASSSSLGGPTQTNVPREV